MTRLFCACLIAALGLSACSDDTELLRPLKNEGSAACSPFTRALADTMTISDFRRSYGVGFSYDGMYGAHCNLRDVHSRVLDLEAIHKWEHEKDWHMPLFTSVRESKFTYKVTTSYSRSEYLQKTCAHADVEAELIVFDGEAAGELTFWEGGDANDFYCTVDYAAPSMEMKLSKGNVQALVRQGNTDFLTRNFREAIDWMDKHKDDATIDSFLVCYGSHVVTRAKVGASLNLVMTMKRDSLLDYTSNKFLGEAAIKYLLRTSYQDENVQRAMHLLNSADCTISMRGGDLSTIPNHLLHFTFGECPDLSQYVDNWSASLNYDPSDYANNNLELTDIEITPIWYFINNQEVAKRVRMRVDENVEELLKSAGYQNYTNTSFQLPQSVTCTMGGQSTTFSQPAVANVIASGRYVATICREQIDLPEVGLRELQVVYPIYNQQVNLGCGYVTYGDVAYNVCWTGGECYVERDTLNTPSADGTIYMTCGVPGSVKYTDIKYQPCHTVIGYEWPLAIQKDGTVDMSKPYYLTYKSGTDFLLRTTDGQEQSGQLDGLPNWTLRNERMVRDQNYYYYWNPNEVNYQ